MFLIYFWDNTDNRLLLTLIYRFFFFWRRSRFDILSRCISCSRSARRPGGSGIRNDKVLLWIVLRINIGFLLVLAVREAFSAQLIIIITWMFAPWVEKFETTGFNKHKEYEVDQEYDKNRPSKIDTFLLFACLGVSVFTVSAKTDKHKIIAHLGPFFLKLLEESYIALRHIDILKSLFLKILRFNHLHSEVSDSMFIAVCFVATYEVLHRVVADTHGEFSTFLGANFTSGTRNQTYALRAGYFLLGRFYMDHFLYDRWLYTLTHHWRHKWRCLRNEFWIHL